MTRPAIRVAIVVPDGLSGRGGIGRVMTYLVRHVAAHAPDIALRPFRTRLAGHGAARHLTVPIALAAFALACVARKIDVAHINVAPRGSTWRKSLFARTARAAGVPVILHLHGSGYDAFYDSLSPPRQGKVRALFGDAARVVALSSYWRAFVVDRLGVPADRVVEIANGVPAADPPAAARDHAVPGIAFLGEVGARKGIDVLIAALATPALTALPWMLRVGGDGAVAAARTQAQDAGIADRVAFLGWVDEAEADRQLRAADIFVLPSRAENQPVSILEAMARAVPVVATRIGAIPEQVIDGETGLLVPPDDPTALADALARLLRDRDARRRMGAAGLARFDEHFSVAIYARKFADLYRTLAR